MNGGGTDQEETPANHAECDPVDRRGSDEESNQETQDNCVNSVKVGLQSGVEILNELLHK